jgi:hypothetical protein
MTSTDTDVMTTDFNLISLEDVQRASPYTDNDLTEVQINESDDARIAIDAAADTSSEGEGAAEDHNQSDAMPDDLTRNDGTADVNGILPRLLNTAEIVQACDRIAAVAEINTVVVRFFDNTLQHFCGDRDQQVVPREFKHRRRELEMSTQALQDEYNGLLRGIARNIGLYNACDSIRTALDTANDAVTRQDRQYWDMMESMRMARRKEREFWRRMARIYATQESEESESHD